MEIPESVEERWQKLGPSLLGVLAKAGVTTVEQLAALTNPELRAIPGIGPSRRKRIRTLFKAPKTATQLVPQPQGGALRRGGPRKVGPTTREIRAEASKRFMPLLKELSRVAMSKKESTADRLQAINTLGRFGPGTQREIVTALDKEKAKALITDLAGAVEKHVLDEPALDAVLEEWKAIFVRYFPG